ncbi:MAG: DUF374 domain-containing protein [Devosia sp.]
MSDEAAPQAGPFALWLRRAAGGWLLGPYLRLVRATSRVIYDPPDFWERINNAAPVILTSWHGQSNLIYSTWPEPKRFAIMISTHPDGQIAQGIAQSFGFSVIEGSGASERQRHGTGGVGAFRKTLRVLAGGQSTIATADIPPVPGRNVSRGLLAMARHAKRPIYAVALVSSRRRVLDRMWDRMQFHFPFSTIAVVAEGPFFIGDTAQEDADSAQLKASLDRVLDNAFLLADEASGSVRQ